MAIVGKDAGIGKFRGRLDGVVYRQLYGKTVAGRRPRGKKRVRKGAELAGNDRFGVAAKRAKCASPEMIARYNQRATECNRGKFAVRMTDYLTPPKIKRVDLSRYFGRPGDEIIIDAWDDFEVKEVTVNIRDLAGVTIETGAASRVTGDLFRYVATTAIAVGTRIALEIVALDWPENKAEWRSGCEIPPAPPPLPEPTMPALPSPAQSAPPEPPYDPRAE